MSEEIKPTPAPGNQPIQLVINFHPDTGKIDLAGCIKNEPLSFWLLEKAKDIIKVYNIQNNQPVIQPAHGIINFVKGAFKG